MRRPSCSAWALLALASLGTLVSTALAGTGSGYSPDGAWSRVDSTQLEAKRGKTRPWVQPDRFAAVALDGETMDALLAAAPDEKAVGGTAQPAIISLPTPDGGYENFEVVYSPVYEAGLEEQMAARGWRMRTYAGTSLERPATTVRLDWGGPQGFHASVLSPEGSYYVDPYWMGDLVLHSSYRKEDLPRRREGEPEWHCSTPEVDASQLPHLKLANDNEAIWNQTGRQAVWNLRTLRLAMSATGEYTTWHGGQTQAQAALVTTVNRMNQVYETDVSVRFELVANNMAVVFPNASTDPYTSSDENTLMNTARDQMIAAFTNTGFDIGHLVSQGGSGGIAGNIGNACVNVVNSAHKGRGFTSRSAPVGDAWDIDFVAHEIGHQMGAQHSWNYCGGGSGHGLSVEPGSGITIMGYAGLCGSSDLAAHSDAMFHGRNIAEINSYVNSAGCSTLTATGNSSAPVVDAGSSYTIPARTPFILTATAGSDGNGDSLTYSWEQNDSGLGSSQATAAGGTSATSGPVFRTHLPSTNPARVFPPMANVLANSTPALGERLSTVTRTMTFRCVVRDNFPGGGRTSFDSMTLNLVNTGAAFAVTSPNGGNAISGPTTVTWDVAGTTGNGINAANVDILLSTDGGSTFPTVLATATPNDGSELIVFPNVTTSTARLMIRGSGSIFFDVSNQNFLISPAPEGPVLQAAGAASFNEDIPGAANGNGTLDPGESDVEIFVPVGNIGTATGTGIVGVLSSLTATASVTRADASYPNIPNGGSSATNTLPYLLTIDPAHPCGDPIELQLDVAADTGDPASFTFRLQTGHAGSSSLILSESFEAATIPTGWTGVVAGNSGSPAWNVRADESSNGTPHSGNRLLSYEPGTTGAASRRFVMPALSGVTTLRFWHSYALEQASATVGNDGVMIEVSTDGPNGPFAPIPEASFRSGGYTHTASGCCGSPLSTGVPFWSGTSQDFATTMQQVEVDLSAWQDETINIAFRYTATSDTAVSPGGWFIDDVEVLAVDTVCDPPPGPIPPRTGWQLY